MQLGYIGAGAMGTIVKEAKTNGVEDGSGQNHQEIRDADLEQGNIQFI